MAHVRTAPLLLSTAVIAALTATAGVAKVDSTLFGLRGRISYDRDNNVSVTERERPAYQALGVRRGQFLVFPKLDLGLGLSDNLSGIADRTTAFWTFNPSVYAATTQVNHQLEFSAGLRGRQAVDLPSENQLGGFVDLGGRLDYRRSTYLQAGARAEKLYEERFASTSPEAAERSVGYYASNVFVSGVHGTGRTRLTGTLAGAGFDYRDVDAFGGGRLDQDFRDQSLWTVQGRAERALSPDTAVFGQVSRTRSKGRTAGAGLDSSGTEVLGGANFDVTQLARGEIGAGYVKRNYKTAGVDDISGYSVRSRLEYFPTRITTVTMAAERNVEDAAFINGGGYFSTTGSARIDHELLRNVLLRGSVAHTRDSYRGIDRSDRFSEVGLGGQYLVNRTVGVGVDLTRRDRTSSGAQGGRDITENRLMVNLVLQR